ncbi:MAG: hypothetical protein QXV17_06950 [Candidatus Micrarchaeaceae archaeon]
MDIVLSLIFLIFIGLFAYLIFFYTRLFKNLKETIKQINMIQQNNKQILQDENIRMNIAAEKVKNMNKN